MIGVEGQYLYSFTAGEATDFIEMKNLKEFTIIEDCGNLLPTFEVNFVMSSESNAMQYLNEGNDFTISYGQNSSSMLSGKYLINKADKGSAIEGMRTIYMNGIFSAMPYLQNAETKIFQDKSSVEVVKEIVEKYFKVECDVQTDDKMNWRQTGIADKVMVNNTLLHSWIPNGQSSVCIGITADGTFRMVDLNKTLSSPKQTFGQGGIDCNTDYNLIEKSTYNNSIAGYGRYKVTEDVDSGMTNVSVASSSTLSGNESPLKKEGAKPKSSQTSFQNENVHKHYNDAEVSNRTNLMTASNILLEFVVQGVYVPVRVLDCIKFVEYSHGNTGATNLNVSGNYLVTKVVRTIANSNMHTIIQCSKDSLSEVKGSFSPVLSSVSSLPNLFSSSLNMGNLSSVKSQVTQVTDLVGKANSIAGDINGGLGQISQYKEQLSALTSLNPTSLASIVPSSDITNMISGFLGFDGGGLLNSSLLENVAPLLGGDLSLGSLTNVGQALMGQLGIDVGDIVGLLTSSYRIPFDTMLLQILKEVVMSQVEIPGIDNIQGLMGNIQGMAKFSRRRRGGSVKEDLEELKISARERMKEVMEKKEPEIDNPIYKKFGKRG